ncbi:nuclear transport factor 2 family protein [Pinibacter soli]|uniref:Nuclear transport factor 2 family protein n=1 Tax=Pinibacter soli TaxID=3044211 RepID=A0ABT6RAW4_9BACT|nr:nuclear transport factor 2 family protein [Pinibacter soli]MDI3319019.1 nuclear transport factor 2 family protein [Pinibacter soli]
MKYALTIALLCFCSLLHAQSEESAIKETINNFFKGMKTSDTALLISAISPNAVLQTVVTNKDQKVIVRTEEMSKFIEFVAKPHPLVFDERIQFETIKIDADLASAWTPYQFFLGDKFSHCGVNSFQLVKLDGKWKIQYIIDTRRKEKCIE